MKRSGEIPGYALRKAFCNFAGSRRIGTFSRMLPRHFYHRIFLLLLPVFFLSFAAHAQDTTEVPQGVVVVKRAPVPAAFRVRIDYFYPEVAGSAGKRSRLSKVDRSEIVFTDTGQTILPPVPLNMSTEQANLSNKALRKFQQRSYPSRAFDWPGFLSDIDFKFTWDDSLRKDSAQVQVTVDKKGKAVYKLLPWKNADSTTVDFENKVVKKLRSRPLWYTARERSARRRRKTHPLTCVAVITVYAYDPNQDRLMPIKVIPN